uniref:Uncharacterized protein LOC100180310 n=1 Tax=Phallusia mammillata TaxID=59560 RepID=A0A6F9DHX8_9ASCI|nr:uncharacterized protein LOC100180310 [Phallusia mammillata]
MKFVDFTCRKLTEEDSPDVIKFIETYFSPRCIATQIFKLNAQMESNFTRVRAKTVIQYNVSLGVFDTKGKLVRVNMARMQKKNETCHYPTTIGKDCPQQQAHMRFYDCLHNDLFDKLGANKLMFLCMDTCHPDYHGQRLWKKMRIYELFESFARENECDYLISSGVNIYIQKILKEAGFSMIREIKYSEYVDPITGCKPDLHLSEIHTSAMVMCKKVA